MKKVLKIDSNGFFIEDVILKDDEITPNDCIEIQCPNGFFKPKWNGIEWVEGLSQEEINKIFNTPIPKTELEILRENQVLMQKALDDILLGGGL